MRTFVVSAGDSGHRQEGGREEVDIVSEVATNHLHHLDLHRDMH